MTNKHKTIKRIELMGGLLPKEMGMSQHLDKERVREKIAKIIFENLDGLKYANAQGKVTNQVADSILSIIEQAGYRLQPTLDVEKLTILPEESLTGELSSGVKFSLRDCERVSIDDLLQAQLTHTKQQIKEMMEAAE